MKNNWQTKKLGDLLELCDAGTWGEEDPKGLPLLRSTNMQNGNLVLDDVKTIVLPKDKIDQYTLLEGDILMTKSSGSIDHIGKSLFITSDMSGKYGFSNFTQRLRPNKSQVLPMWIYYKVSDPATRDFLLGASQTTTGLRNLKISELKELEIPLPPLATQHKIVAILDEKFAKLREAKRLRQEAIADTEKIFGATLREIFEEGKEKGWREVELRDVVSHFQYGSSKKSLDNGEIPCLRMGNLQSGQIDWTHLKFAPKDEEIEKFLLKDGDVLFNRTNSPDLVGKTSIIHGDRPAVFAGYLIRINYKKDVLSGDYLNYCLNSDFAKKFCQLVKTDGVSQSNINAQKLAKFTFPLPTLTEQQKIVTRLDTLSEKLRTLRELQQSQLEDMKKLEKAYLREAFRGELQ